MIGGCDQANETASRVQEQNSAKQGRDQARACVDGVKVAAEVLAKLPDFKSAIEISNRARIERADAAYQRTIGNPNYEETPAGIGLAIDLDNAAKDARIASLKEQIAIVKLFAPLSEKVQAALQQERLEETSGNPSASSRCDRAASLLASAKQVLTKVSRTSKVLRDVAAGELALVNAALGRIAVK